jgi:transcriptional regulator with XRE-family HTH domain
MRFCVQSNVARMLTVLNMKTYEFTIIASGLDPEAEDFEDRFFEAGCDDATILFQKGAIILEFTREAPTFAKALISAFADVQKAGAKVERIEPDHLVSLSDIAARSGLSRSAISLYAKGERGENFPAPVARVTSESPLWDWADVSRWMLRHSKLSQDEVLHARMVKEANLVAQSPALKRDQFVKQLTKRAKEMERSVGAEGPIKMEVRG